jgi:hypothetical protein
MLARNARSTTNLSCWSQKVFTSVAPLKFFAMRVREGGQNIPPKAAPPHSLKYVFTNIHRWYY